jgi:hypothetical protein
LRKTLTGKWQSITLRSEIMKLIIELTNGVKSVSGDCGCISELMTGESERSIEYMYCQKIPRYHFEE